jgi:thiamine-monophosphate kinase
MLSRNFDPRGSKRALTRKEGVMSDLDPETDMIQSLFAPLALGATGSYGLGDDVAFVPTSEAGIIVTQDQVIEGTHFFPNDPLEIVAKRLVRRNLSDIIAKGGVPTAAFLSLAWPKSRDREGIARFAQGLGEDLAQLCDDCPLMGGDTSTTNGPLVASLTMMGRPTAPNGQPVLRSGAQVGDVIAVTGVIGDAWLGLQVRHGILNGRYLKDCIDFAMAPYPPTLKMAPLIGQYAKASLDVSDGLLLDALRLANASGVAIIMALDELPISEEAEMTDFPDAEYRNALLATGGDDYQPLIAIKPNDFSPFKAAAKKLGVRVTRIGTCVAGEGLSLTYLDEPFDLPLSLGWEV